MPESTISRAQVSVKLYSVNGSALLENEGTQSSDGRVKLARRAAGGFLNGSPPCDSAFNFEIDYNGNRWCFQPTDRADFCNRSIRIIGLKEEQTKTCVASMTNVGSRAVGDGSCSCCNWWCANGCCQRYSIEYFTYTTTMNKQVTCFQQQLSYRPVNGETTPTITDSAVDCCAPTQPNPPFVDLSDLSPSVQNNIGWYFQFSASRALFDTVANSAKAYCDWTPPPVSTSTPVLVSTSTPVLESTSTPVLESTPTIEPSTVQVDATASQSNETATIEQTEVPLPSSQKPLPIRTTQVNPFTPINTPQITNLGNSGASAGNMALGALGLLAVAPVGLGVVAAVVAARGIYKWCYPDKPEEDIEEAQSPQETQESAVAQIAVVEPSADQGYRYPIATIANWIHRKPVEPVFYDAKNQVVKLKEDGHVYEDVEEDEHVYEPINEIELQTKETV